MIYFPGGRVPPVDALPPDVGRDVEEVVLETDDGLRLDAWYLPVGSRAPAVLLLHGNGGTRAGRLPLARALAELGLSTLLVDYRGYGGNAGTPSEEGLAADARAGLGHLEARADVTDVVYFGESLGAAVAVGLAVERPPAAVVLRSPFTSLADVASAHYPVPRAVIEASLPDRYPSVDRVAEVRAPVLVIAGRDDRIVPFEHGRRLFEAASEPKRFVAIDAADHNDPELFTGRRLLGEVERFLAEHGVIG